MSRAHACNNWSRSWELSDTIFYCICTACVWDATTNAAPPPSFSLWCTVHSCTAHSSISASSTPSSAAANALSNAAISVRATCISARSASNTAAYVPSLSQNVQQPAPQPFPPRVQQPMQQPPPPFSHQAPPVHGVAPAAAASTLSNKE